MFAQIVSLITVAAVVACPMWCGSGLCHDAQCCATKTVTPDTETCTSHCCRGKSAPAEDQDRPAPSPKESSCQGVCGGAVLEKPAELPTLEDSLCLPLIDREGAIVSSQAERSSTSDGVDIQCRGNYGRLLRTLRMSILV